MGKVRRFRKRAALAAHEDVVVAHDQQAVSDNDDVKSTSKKDRRKTKRSQFVGKLVQQQEQQQQEETAAAAASVTPFSLSSVSGLSDLWMSLDQSLVDNEQAQQKSKRARRPTKRTAKNTKQLAVREAQVVAKITAHPNFQADPLAALTAHISQKAEAREKTQRKERIAKRSFAKNKTLNVRKKDVDMQ